MVQVACRDSGKTMVDAMFGEVMVTCEKLRWTIAKCVSGCGEGFLVPLLVVCDVVPLAIYLFSYFFPERHGKNIPHCNCVVGSSEIFFSQLFAFIIDYLPFPWGSEAGGVTHLPICARGVCSKLFFQ